MATLDENQKNRRKKNFRTALIITGILAVLLMLFFIGHNSYKMFNRIETLEEEKTLAQEEAQTLRKAKEDSKVEIARLNSKIEEMKADHKQEISNKNDRISNLQSKVSENARLRDRIEKYENLQSELKNLREEHEDLSKKMNLKEEKIASLEENLEVIRDSINASRTLKAYNIVPLTKWEPWICADRYNVSKARRVDKTMISFEIAGNLFVKTGIRQVYLKMINPEGETMYPSDEKFEIQETEESDSYTKRAEIDYTGEIVPVEFIVEHPEKLESGDYVIEVYVDGKLVRTKLLTLQ